MSGCSPTAPVRLPLTCLRSDDRCFHGFGGTRSVRRSVTQPPSVLIPAVLTLVALLQLCRDFSPPCLPHNSTCREACPGVAGPVAPGCLPACLTRSAAVSMPLRVQLSCLRAGASLMSKIAAGHGGNDHQKASSFMSDTLDKVGTFSPSHSCIPASWSTQALLGMRSWQRALEHWLYMPASSGCSAVSCTTCFCRAAALTAPAVLQGGDGVTQRPPLSSVSLLAAQASLRLKNFASLNLTDLLPSGVTFTDPMFFRNAASNVTSAASVLLRPSPLTNDTPCCYHLHAERANQPTASVELLWPRGI